MRGEFSYGVSAERESTDTELRESAESEPTQKSGMSCANERGVVGLSPSADIYKHRIDEDEAGWPVT